MPFLADFQRSLHQLEQVVRVVGREMVVDIRRKENAGQHSHQSRVRRFEYSLAPGHTMRRRTRLRIGGTVGFFLGARHRIEGAEIRSRFWPLLDEALVPNMHELHWRADFVTKEVQRMMDDALMLGWIVFATLIQLGDWKSRNDVLIKNKAETAFSDRRIELASKCEIAAPRRAKCVQT